MNKTSKFLLGLSLFFMILSVYFVSQNLYKNQKIISNFPENKDAYPYAEAIENKAIDLDEISKYAPEGYAADMGPKLKEDIVSPVTISYYKDIDDKVPAYVIKKGETIHFSIYDGKVRDNISYCITESLPTNRKGWRLSMPFGVDGKAVSDKLLYVKLDDLMDVAYKWLDENPIVLKFPRYPIPMENRHNKYDVSRVILLYFDQLLYQNGVFLSKDILSPIFSARVILSMSASIISFVLFLLYRKERKYKLYNTIKKVFCLKNR